MDVIINAECNSIPGDCKLLPFQKEAALNLLMCLGYDPVDLPLADLLRRSHNLEGNWIILSPVHWQASHNDAMITATGAELHLSEEEAKNCFKIYSEYLAADGITLFYHNADTWLLCTENKPALKAKSVYQILNHSLMPELAALDTTMYWQKFFTESQMFFATHHNNSALNGIWAWSDAQLIARKQIPICADEHFLPLAKICSSNIIPYSSTVKLKEFKILLLNDFNSLSAVHQEEIKKIPAHWYWNNSAYTRSDRNWFTRFWRNLTHAH